MMNSVHVHIEQRLLDAVDKKRVDSAMFFKTNPEEYAAHDQFMGVSVPALRLIAKDFMQLTLDELAILLASPINEKRLLALIIMTVQYKKADGVKRHEIFTFYLEHRDRVNNWNLVDSSAHLIVGAHLIHGDKVLLFELARSQDLWSRRIAIIATWWFIRHGVYQPTVDIALVLLHDKHDLIHKAVGWMLREMGKKDLSRLITFLDLYANVMPRTMLRYAIEKLSSEQRQHYMKKS